VRTGEIPGRDAAPGPGSTTKLVDAGHHSTAGQAGEGLERALRCRQAPGSKSPDEPLLPGFGAAGR
jgi:hypothetical protein